MHALYGFTRTTDEIVDRLTGEPIEERARHLRAWGDAFAAALAGELTADPVLPAVVDTIHRFGLCPDDFEAFLGSMAMDLTTTRYETYDDLLGYMAGSAAAIGSMMLPILGAPDLDRAREPARQLGLAFQLTNFIRDVGEDLDRGRVYLPMADLAAHGVTPADLRAGRRPRPCGPWSRSRSTGPRHYRLAAPASRCWIVPPSGASGRHTSSTAASWTRLCWPTMTRPAGPRCRRVGAWPSRRRSSSSIVGAAAANPRRATGVMTPAWDAVIAGGGLGAGCRWRPISRPTDGTTGGCWSSTTRTA